MLKLKEIKLERAKMEIELPNSKNFKGPTDQLKKIKHDLKNRLIAQAGYNFFCKIKDLENPVQVELVEKEVEKETEDKYLVEVKAWEVKETD